MHEFVLKYYCILVILRQYNNDNGNYGNRASNGNYGNHVSNKSSSMCLLCTKARLLSCGYIFIGD